MRVLLAALLLLPVVACMHTEGPVRIPADQAKARLAFEYNDDFQKDVTLDWSKEKGPAQKGYAANMEGDVAEACGGTKSALFGAAATYLVTQGVAFLVDQADKALQEEIAKYTAAYQAGADVELYAPGETLELRHRCLRVTRMSIVDPEAKKKNPALKPEVLMDFVALLELHPPHRTTAPVSFPSVLKITPLRLYFAAPAVKSGDGKYGVTAALDMEIFWREDNRGYRQLDYPQISLLSETVNFNPDGAKNETAAAKWRYKSFIHDKDGTKTDRSTWAYRIAPLPAWTTYGAVDYGGNFVRAKVSIAEAGNVPGLLEKSAALFSDNKDKIEEKLREAIIKAAGLE